MELFKSMGTIQVFYHVMFADEKSNVELRQSFLTYQIKQNVLCIDLYKKSDIYVHEIQLNA